MTATDSPATGTLPGSRFPLGATVSPGGTNFAVASEVADGMMLCLFDDAGAETQVPMRDYDAGIWHVFAPGVRAGHAYGYRVTGPYDPARGARCNPAKLLLDFWRSHPVGIGEFANRFCGSADMCSRARRRPTASVNLITVHDGFTLRDLVSYNDKHNEANGESNRDGTDDNRSWNCGVEGPAEDLAVLALRARQTRAMLTTLLLSFGIPMLLGGDEIGRTQQGNNNAYCQDNEITWFDWSAMDTGLRDFTRRVIALRRSHPVFRRRRFLAGAKASELRWFTPAGSEMTVADRSDPDALAIALYLDGSDDPDQAGDGTWLVDDDFLVLVNAWWEPLDFVLPATREHTAWRLEIDTFDPGSPAGSANIARHAGDRITVGPRSVSVLRGPAPAP